MLLFPSSGDFIVWILVMVEEEDVVYEDLVNAVTALVLPINDLEANVRRAFMAGKMILLLGWKESGCLLLFKWMWLGD